MTPILMLAVSTAAFLALSAAMPRHQTDLFRRKLSKPESRRARWGGWILLAALLALAIIPFGVGRGLPMFAGYATSGAGMAVALQCWCGRRTKNRR